MLLMQAEVKKGLEEASNETRNAILSAFTEFVVNTEEGFSSSDGINLDGFQKMLTDGTINAINTAFDSGKLSDYADLFESDKVDDTLKELLENSIPLLKTIKTLGADIIREFDEIGYSSEEINKIWAQLANNELLSGVKAEEAFKRIAESTKDIEDNDEKRATVLGLLQESVSKAQTEARQKIVDGTLEAKKEELKDLQDFYDGVESLSLPSELKEAIYEDRFGSKENLLAKIHEIQEEINATENAADNLNITYAEMENLLGIMGLDKAAEEFTKLSSSMENLSKITDIQNLSLAEQLKIMQDFPELSNSIAKGYLTQEEALNTYANRVDEIKEKMNNFKNVGDIYKVAVGDNLASSEWGKYSSIFSTDANGNFTSVPVKKNATGNEVDAISGGTITSTAVSDMLYNDLNFYQNYRNKIVE